MTIDNLPRCWLLQEFFAFSVNQFCKLIPNARRLSLFTHPKDPFNVIILLKSAHPWSVELISTTATTQNIMFTMIQTCWQNSSTMTVSKSSIFLRHRSLRLKLNFWDHFTRTCFCALSTRSTKNNINVQTGSAMMERKRFTEAFHQLALMDMWQLFNAEKPLSTLKQSHDVDRNISDIIPSLKLLFQQYYSEHRCNIPGCGVVIGFDADCKVSFG